LALRVLVADDCRDTVETTMMLLRLWGHEGTAAYDGPAALDLARRHRPDLALVDVAMPRVEDGLDLAGRLHSYVPAIAQKIVDQGGHYALTVKDNQEHLLQDIQQQFEKALDTDFACLEHDTYETREQGHGREEYRWYTVLHMTEGIRHADAWAGLTTIGMCYSERTVQGETTTEVR
jgi:CheY-like chemotaxis protein